MVYIGFSLGAMLGVPFVARQPARFPRVVLVEGGHDPWTPERAKAFAAGGGKRVMFACGQESCLVDAKRAEAVVAKAGVATKIVYGPGVGHGYTGAVADAIAKELGWLLEGDPRFMPPPEVSPRASRQPEGHDN
jgi:pimeloyl-ACP methyl ester carboxylesterase